MSSIGRIEKKTDNRFLNFYEFEAIHRNGRVSPYYVASRAKKTEDLKAVSQQNRPDGVILYGVYGEEKDQIVQDNIIPATQYLLDSYGRLTPKEKNELWKQVLEKITYYKKILS